MSTVTGVVKVCKQGKFGWGLLLEEEDGKWYNSKFEIKANAGDSVSFDDGGKNYVNKLRILGAGAPPTAGSSPVVAGRLHHLPVPLENSRAIIRQNALTNAREFVLSTEGDGSTIEEVIKVARIFEEYTSGDADVASAMNKLKDMEVS